MGSDVELKTDVMAVDRVDLLPPSSDYVAPVVAGVATESTTLIWPHIVSVVLIFLILILYKKIRVGRA